MHHFHPTRLAHGGVKLQASGEEDSAVSDNSLLDILHSILGGSSNRSSIGGSRSEGSFGGDGDDYSCETTDFVQDDVEKPPIEEQEEADLVDHGAGKGIVEDERQMKRPDHTANTVQTMAYHVSDDPYRGSSHEENHRRSTESIHQGQKGGRSSGHVGAGYNDGRRSKTNEAKSKSDSNDIVRSNTHYNGNNSKDDDDDNYDGDDGIDIGNGTVSKNGSLADLDHGDRKEAEPTRWPSRQSVESSSGYMFFARLAGDYPDGIVPGLTTPRSRQWRRRRTRPRRQRRSLKLRRQTDEMEQRQQELRSQSSHKRAVTKGFSDEVGKEAGGPERRNQDEEHASSTYRAPGRDARPAERTSGSGGISGVGGVNFSKALSSLERDMKGAMVAVWLAWGVRIDAAREKLRREERWLDAVHRTERAKVADGGMCWSIVEVEKPFANSCRQASGMLEAAHQSPVLPRVSPRQLEIDIDLQPTTLPCEVWFPPYTSRCARILCGSMMKGRNPGSQPKCLIALFKRQRCRKRGCRSEQRVSGKRPCRPGEPAKLEETEDSTDKSYSASFPGNAQNSLFNGVGDGRTAGIHDPTLDLEKHAPVGCPVPMLLDLIVALDFMAVL